MINQEDNCRIRIVYLVLFYKSVFSGTPCMFCKKKLQKVWDRESPPPPFCPWMELHSTFFRRTRRTAPLCLGTRTFIVDDFQQVCLRVGTMTDQRSTTPRRARLYFIAHKTLPKTERTQGLGAFDICEQIQMKTNFSGTFLENCHKPSNSL